MLKRKVRLEDWAVVRSAQYPCFEDLQPGAHLMGFAIGHPRLPDESLICTSRIVSVDKANGAVETSHSLYQLGQPDETYQSWQLSGPDSVYDDRLREIAA